MTADTTHCPKCGSLLERDSGPATHCDVCGADFEPLIQEVETPVPKVPAKKVEAKKLEVKKAPTKVSKPEPVKAKKKKK